MGFVNKITSSLGGISDPFGDISAFSGRSGEEAALKASQQQEVLGREALTLLDPFQGVGQQGLDRQGFLTDPNAQFNFLQNNPLFQAAQQQGQAATDTATQNLLKSSAARGRLSAGDTLQEIGNIGEQSSRNLLLAGQPLIQDQKQSIGDLLNFGAATAGNQGNLLTGLGANEAAGTIGAANARSQGAQNVAALGATAASFFSDPALKENVRLTHKENGHNVYSWTWSDKAGALGLSGDSFGVLATEVKQINPEAVSIGDNGFMKVNYELIGVKHGN